MFGQARKTQRRTPRITDEEEWLRARIIAGVGFHYWGKYLKELTLTLNPDVFARKATILQKK